jgi:cell division protein ZapA
MAQVTIEVNGRAYTVGCEDGQENHLIELARHFDRQVRQVGQEVGQLGETRLFLMGALLLAEVARLQAEHTRLEMAAVGAIDTAAHRIEMLATKAAG